MRRRVVLPLFLAAAASLGVQPSVARAQLPPPTVPEGFGVNIHFTDPQPGEMGRFREAGFRLARMDLFWSAVERTKGVYDFAAYDRLVDHLAKAGARPLFILDYGNALYDDNRAPHTDAGRAAFARFAGAAAARYRGRGVLWEIWNEPNLAQFWKPGPNPRDYAALALATAKAVRAADPKATILAPGSSGFPWEFFETVFRSGLLAHIDAVSVHPYRGQAPETAAADYARLRVLIARHAPAAKRDLPIVSSEWGYSTVVGGVSEERQAQYLVRQWLANLSAGVNVSIFYDWRDDGDDPKENEHRFGTVRRDFEPKPSFLAARKLIADLSRYTFRHRLLGKTDRDWRLLFQKGDRGDLALVTWTTDETAPEAARTPRIRNVRAADADFRDLRRLAAIRYAAGPRAEGTGRPARLSVVMTNPEAASARVGIAVGTREHRTLLAPGKRWEQAVQLPLGTLRDDRPPLPVRLTWDNKPLPPVAPLVVRRTDPLLVTATPRGPDLLVTVENPARTAFDGTLTLIRSGQKTERPLKIANGVERVEIRLPSPGGNAHHLRLADKQKNDVARTPSRRYLPFAGFPAQAGAAAGYGRLLYVENAARKPEPLEVIRTPAGSPAPTALAFAFDFGTGWYYAQAVPQKTTPIPRGASSLVFWAHSDGSGDYLRARFRDRTGQTFQPDLGKLDWKGWRLVTIPFTGASGGSWGGANDGVPHPPLAWDGLILVDSSNRENAHKGQVLIAAPVYVLE